MDNKNNNSVDMSGFMNNLNGMLENGSMPDNIKNLLNNMKNDNKSNDTKNSDTTSDTEKNFDDKSNSSESNSSGISPEMISNIMNMFKNSTNSDSTNESSDSTGNSPNIDIDMLLKMKTIMEKMNGKNDDPRSKLLLSLKPYLKESRKGKVEQYIQLFNMGKVMDVFNPKRW